MYDQVLFIVLNKIDLLDRLLEEFKNCGVGGATVVNSIGMAHELADKEESHFISSFRAFFGGGRSESKTIFTACDQATADKAKDAVRRIVGDLSTPDSAIMFGVPLLYIEGVTHID